MIAPVLCLLLLLLQVLPSVNALGEPANATPAGPAKAAVAEPAPQSPVEPPKRTRVTCAQYRANVEKSAKHAVPRDSSSAGSSSQRSACSRWQGGCCPPRTIARAVLLVRC